MNKEMKRVKGPLTDGFLLTDIRLRAGSSFSNHPAKKSTKSIITLLTGAILVFSFVMTGLPTGGRKVLAESSKASHQRRSKLSSDLEDAMVRNPHGTLRVIVDTRPSTSSAVYSKLLAKIAGMGGIVFRNLNQGKSVSIQIPASVVVTLSADSAVKFVSLDRATQVAGHLET